MSQLQEDVHSGSLSSADITSKALTERLYTAVSGPSLGHSKAVDLTESVRSFEMSPWSHADNAAKHISHSVLSAPAHCGCAIDRRWMLKLLITGKHCSGGCQPLINPAINQLLQRKWRCR